MLFLAGYSQEVTLNDVLSIGGAALSVVAAGLTYRYSRIAASAVRTRALGISDVERVRDHETESVVLLRALEVFGDSDRALEWMGASNPSLNNESPIRAIQTEDGRREVLNILGRIQHGVLS